MIMLDEWDKDKNNDMAPLGPLVEIAGSTFGGRFDGATSGMVHCRRLKRVSWSKATGWLANLNLSSITQ